MRLDAVIPAADRADRAPRPAAAPAVERRARPQPSAPPSSPEETRAAADALNRYLRRLDVSLTFEIDDASGRTVVRLIDGATREIIRQVPSAEMLALARTLAARRGPAFIEASA